MSFFLKKKPGTMKKAMLFVKKISPGPGLVHSVNSGSRLNNKGQESKTNPILVVHLAIKNRMGFGIILGIWTEKRKGRKGGRTAELSDLHDHDDEPFNSK